MIFCICDFITAWSIASYPKIFQSIPVKDKLATPAIDHDVLLWKLNNFFGIRGLPLKLLASYLQGRQQYTVIDGCTSVTLNITQGVSQGSSLAPLSFALYMNDLPSTTKLTLTLFQSQKKLMKSLRQSHHVLISSPLSPSQKECETNPSREEKKASMFLNRIS